MLLGIVIWNFFAEVTNSGLKAIVERGDIIRKINFPKYIIILSSGVSAFINLILNLLVIIVFMAVNQVELSWSVLLAPLFILEVFVFAIGASFILSTLYVRLRDINYIWEVIMQALFYASAVIYPIVLVVEKSSLAAQVLLLNPVAQAIQDARHALISPVNPTLYSLSESLLISAIPIGIVIIVAIFGSWYFRKRSPYFAEEV
jgi:ABC-2 type transport system permease protein